MKNICVITFYTSNYTIGRYTSVINDAYCKKNGYDFYLFTKIPNRLKNRHPAWCKFYYLGKVISLKKYDYVMWIDADAFFCNDKIRIEKWITDEEKNFFICRDASYAYDKYMFQKELVNTGVMIFKNTKWSEDLLHYLLINKDFKNFYNQFPWDQTPLQSCYKNNYNNIVDNTEIIFDLNFNNNTNDILKYIDKGGFIIHCTCFGIQDSNKTFKDKDMTLTEKHTITVHSYITMKGLPIHSSLKYTHLQHFHI